jgi:hypothetical protein
VCTGGEPSGLTLDVRSVDVAGELLVNGQAPQDTAECYDAGYENVWSVRFTEVDYSYTFTFGEGCGSDFTFAGPVFPGTYRVAAGGDRSDTTFPGSGQVIYERLRIE